jgi:diadenosine tetraphosphatase ApaH/serine/threonine PP2A family protein phosphatase
MRIGLISDVHANLPALQAVLEACSIRCDAHWCLGDTVGYGASPNECVALVRDRCELVLAGNHDLAATGRVDFSAFTSDAGRAIRWTREVLAADAEAWLGGLEPTAQRGPIGLYHASPRDPVWEYIADAAAALDALSRTTNELVLVGHTHVPLAARLVDDRLIGGQAAADSIYDVRGGRHTLLNPGSVGQPRDGDARAAWMLLYLDDDGRPARAVFQRVRYDVAAAQRAIEEAGLPQHLADRLSFGM